MISVAMDGPGFSDGPFELCSTSTWTACMDWIAGLDNAPKLQELAKQGKVTGTEAVAAELETYLVEVPENVMDTVLALCEHIGEGAVDETVYVGELS